MSQTPRLPKRVFTIFPTRASVHQEIDAELQFHLDARIAELTARGLSQADARRTALAEYGDVAAARQELASIDRRRLGRAAFTEWLASWRQDLRFAIRALRARPGFSVTILLTLALGLGGNAAIFSVVDSVLLRPLPYANPDRLVHLWETFTSKVDQRSEASFPDYLDWRARSRSFSDLAGYSGGGVLVGGSQPATVGAGRVTANFFDVLGVRPAIGRVFAAGEDAVDAPKIAILGHGLWERQFGSDPGIVGRTITLNGAPATVVGVLPEAFTFARLSGAEVWVPIDRGRQAREQRGNHWLNVVARLKPGVTVAAAREDLSRIMADLAREYPPSNAGREGSVVPLREELVGSVRPVLVLLYGAVVVVLLVACVNVANLLLIRGADRQREIAVRVALGAGRGRLIRQLLTESLVLSILGGLLGLLVAKISVHGLLALIPPGQMRGIPPITARLDGRIVAYAIGVSVAAGLGFGLIPALRLTSSTIYESLKSGGRGSSGGASILRDTLVVAEVALTVVLLSGALLFGRSVERLLAIDPGFRADHVATTTVVVPSTRYNAASSQVDFFQRFMGRVREIPGVEAVGLVSRLPLDFGNSLGLVVVGQPAPAPGQEPTASYRQVTPDYFSAMRIPIVAGRAFNDADDLHAPTTVVVNRTFAAAYLGAGEPVGQRVVIGGDTAMVVGLVGDVPIGKIEDRIPPTIYLSFLKSPQPSMAVAVRTAMTAAQVSGPLRSALSALEPSAAMSAVTAMEDLITASPSVFVRRLPLFLVGAFAVTALLLAIVGIYGVVSYSVTQRTREMGIRSALGARPGSLVRLVVAHGVRMAVAGIIVGVGSAIFVGRIADNLLYGVRPTDAGTYIVVALILGTMAVAATILPARRATRVDPALALRSD